ncbi:MAG TPA: RNA polymerase sigma factor [Chitinophagaceae bacterium]|nr:RNA polymerase sigma factor [Chitinophagaceae bacterium]
MFTLFLSHQATLSPTKPTYTEHELVELLRLKSQEGFSYLYDNYSGALYAVIVSIVTEKEQAAEILQDVFLKIWKQIPTYNEQKGRLYTWMMQITRNTAIDHIRSRGHKDQQKNRELSDSVFELGGSDFNPDKIGLRQIVHKLKEEYRELVELSYFHGLTQEEISKSLDMPLGTVKTRMRSALIQLRELFKP